MPTDNRATAERVSAKVTYEVDGLESMTTKRKAMRRARWYDKNWPDDAPHRVYRLTTTITRERVSHADK